MTSILKVTEIQDPTNGNKAIEIDSSGNLSVSENLKVDNIQNASGTSALSIDSSGNLSVSEVLKVPDVPYALVDFGGTGYVAKSAGAVLDFDNIVEQNGSHYSTSTYEFTCPVNGIYMVSCGIITNSNSAQVGIDLEKNGSIIFKNRFYFRAGQFTNTIKCSANDTLRLKTSGAETIYEGTGTDRYSFACYTLLFGN